MTAMFPPSTMDWHPALWLAVLCAPLLGLVMLFSCIPRRRDDTGEIRLGNPLLRGTNHSLPAQTPTSPLAQLCRTLGDAELRSLITGMRHLPFKEAVPLLRRQLKSTDPELHLYAQCVLHEGQTSLQDRFQLLAQKATAQESPAILASFLEAALALLQSPLTPESEHAALASRMRERMATMLPELDHPRALHIAAKCLLHLREPAAAQTLQARLPADSPLHRDLARHISHAAAIQNPPPSASAGYEMT